MFVRGGEEVLEEVLTVHRRDPANTPRGFHVETTWKRWNPRGVFVGEGLPELNYCEQVGRGINFDQNIIS